MYPVFVICALIWLAGAIRSFYLFKLRPARHILPVSNSNLLHWLQPSCLAWDPISQHFVVGAITGPTVYAISDTGVVDNLLSDYVLTSTNASVTSLVVDPIRRRLIVAFANPPLIAAYDLTVYRRIFGVPLPEMDSNAGGVALDSRSGEAFVSSSKRGVVWKVGLQGTVRVFSESRIFGDQGLGGIVHDSCGYLIVVQPSTGNIFKVDSKDGAVKQVLSKSWCRESSKLLVPGGHVIAMQPHLSVVVATNKTLHSMESDNMWRQAKVQRKRQMEEGATVVAIAMREGKIAYYGPESYRAYALVKSQAGYRIEEVFWNILSWRSPGLELMGFCLAFAIVFFYFGFTCSSRSCKVLKFSHKK